MESLKEFLTGILSDRTLKDELRNWREYTERTVNLLEKKHDKDIDLLEKRHEKELVRLLDMMKISGQPRSDAGLSIQSTYPSNQPTMQQYLPYQQQQQLQQQQLQQQLLQQQLYVQSVSFQFGFF